MPKLPLSTAQLVTPLVGRVDVLLERASKAEAAGDREAAIELYRRVLTVDPTRVQAINRLGVAAGSSDDLMTAMRHFESSLRIDPNQPEVWFYYAIGFAKLGLVADALNACERALALSPQYQAALLQRLGLLVGLGRYEQALTASEAVMRYVPNDSRGALLRGEALQWCGHYETALRSFDNAIAVNSHRAEALVAKAKLLLLLGDLPHGLPLYEARWKTIAWHESPRFPRRANMRPLWLGDSPLEGKTILLYAEQGYGDVIHFCRYAPMVARAGAAKVIVETNEPLVRLMTTLDGVSTVISDDDPLLEHDICCPMMSLPLAFRTTLDTIPAPVPYLRADPDDTAVWRNRLADLPGRRIGLVWWAGARIGDAELVATEQRKSLPLDLLAPFAEVTNCSFVSLQLGPAAKQAATPPPGMVLHDFTSDLKDFADTAALMENLDLVISVCTSAAHLAGALARPVWLLNRFDTDWRWLLDREDTPWYPTMRIFRQPRPGEWRSVVRSVADALRLFAAS